METLEQHQERTGTELGPQGIRLADSLHATPPNGHEGLTDAEMEKVARHDLGCSRRSTYRDLGRGSRQGWDSGLDRGGAQDA
jgi:hypothetical protein